jgi:hypothetical protein
MKYKKKKYIYISTMQGVLSLCNISKLSGEGIFVLLLSMIFQLYFGIVPGVLYFVIFILLLLSFPVFGQ